MVDRSNQPVAIGWPKDELCGSALHPANATFWAKMMVDYEASIEALDKRHSPSCQAMTFPLANLGVIKSQL